MTQSFNNTTIANTLYPVANGTTSSSPFVVEFQGRDPTIYDIQYPIQKLWLNTTDNNFWFLKNFTTANGVVFANWISFGGTSVVETLTGDDNVVVEPFDNNINIFGNVVTPNGTDPKPVYFKHGLPASGELDLDVQVSVATASSSINSSGLSSFSSNNFNVDANGYVTFANNFAFFTPTAFGGTVAGTTTYSSQNGSYYRIGSLVFVQYTLGFSNSGGSGDLMIGGLPYRIGGAISREAFGPLYSTNLTFPAGTTYVISEGIDSTTTCILTACGSGTAESNVQITTADISVASSFIYFTSDPF